MERKKKFINVERNLRIGRDKEGRKLAVLNVEKFRSDLEEAYFNHIIESAAKEWKLPEVKLKVAVSQYKDILLKMDDAQIKAAGVKGSPERALHDAQLRLIAETTGLAESDILDTFDAWLDGLSN
jgi:hypothetical protein